MKKSNYKFIRYLRLAALLFGYLLPAQLLATHIVGGEITYRYVGETATKITYRIGLNVYRDCRVGNEPFDQPAYVAIFDGNDDLKYALVNLNFTGETRLDPPDLDDCLINPGNVCVSRSSYSSTVTIDKNPAGGFYRIVYERCCRNSTINNIVNPLETGSVYDVILYQAAIDNRSSSPSFSGQEPKWPPIFVCKDVSVDFDHSAYDLDGDRLVYEMCTPLTAATQDDPKPRPGRPEYFSPDEFGEVQWNNGDIMFSTQNMLGADSIPDLLRIDPETGFLTGTPRRLGQYVVGVCVKEYDDVTGALLSESRRDFQYNVRDCGAVFSSFFTDSIHCDLTVGFEEMSPNAEEFLWYFDWPNSNLTSTESHPTFTYSEIGEYTVALIAKKSEDCQDTSFKKILLVENTIDIAFDTTIFPCDNEILIKLKDQTIDLASPIKSWLWEVTNDVDGSVVRSGEQNPILSLPLGAKGAITLTVTSENGCQKTLTLPYDSNEVEDPGPTQETFIEACVGDVVALNPNTEENPEFIFEWSPEAMVSDPSASNPEFTVTEGTNVIRVEISLEGGNCVLTREVTVVGYTPPQLSLKDTTICSGTSLFLDAGTGPNANFSYRWNGPNNFASVDATPKISGLSADNSGTYNVTVTDDLTGCRSEGSFDVQVSVLNGVSVVSNDPSSCTISDGNITIVGLTPGISYQLTYRKDNGGETIVDLTADTNGEIILDNLGVGEYGLSISDGGECVTDLGKIVLENPSVEVSANEMTLCEGETLELVTRVTKGSGQYSYSWTGPAGFTSTEANPVIPDMQLANSGTYTVVVTDEVTNCVSADNSIDIVIGNPQITLTANDPSSCTISDGSITISGLNARGHNYTILYSKDGVDQPIINGASDASGEILIPNLGVGLYEVRATSSEGCEGDPASIVLENPSVEVSANETTLCEGETLELMTTVTKGSGQYSYSWTGPAGFTSTEANPVIPNMQLANGGTYTVVVTDDVTNCVSADNSIDIVIGNPQITLTANDPSSCTISDGSITVGGLIAGAEYTITYSKDGVAQPDVRATADGSGEIVLPDLGVGSYEVQATSVEGCEGDPVSIVLENPSVEVSANETTLCEGETLELMTTVTKGSGQYSYSWTGPAGFTSTEANPVIPDMQLANAGTYTVVVTDDVTNCVSADNSIDIVIGNPQITLTPNDPSSCTLDDGSIVIGNLSAGVSYTVKYSKDGVAQTEVNATADSNGEIELENLGVGEYEVTVTNETGCSSEPAKTTLENPRVDVSISNPAPCEGEDVTLMTTVTGGSGQYSYSWTGPNNFTSTEANPVISGIAMAQSGQYTVVVTDDVTACVSLEKSVEISVNPNLQVELMPQDPRSCTESDGSIVIGSLVAGRNYTVDYKKDGVQQTSITEDANAMGEITISDLGIGSYEIVVTDENGCSSAPQTVSLKNPRVEVSASNESPCEGEDVSLTATVTGGSGNYSYQWTGPGGFSSTEANPVISAITASQDGTYTVVVTDTETNCVSDEESIEINVKPLPQIGLTPMDPTSCTEADGSITVSGLMAGETYTVNYSKDGVAQTAVSAEADSNGEIVLDGLGVGDYEVTVTNADACESEPETTTLENPRVEVTASNESPCEGEDVTLMTTVTGGSGTYSYQWTGPNGFSSTEANPLISDITAAQSGTYTVVVTDDVSGCVSKEKSIDVTVEPKIQISLTPMDPTSCTVPDGSITIGNLEPGVEYTVNYSLDSVAQTAFNATADANGEIVIPDLGVGAYEVSVADEDGCESEPANTSLENPRVEVSASDETPCEGQDVTLMTTVTGGSGNYSYQWTGAGWV